MIKYPEKLTAQEWAVGHDKLYRFLYSLGLVEGKDIDRWRRSRYEYRFRRS